MCQCCDFSTTWSQGGWLLYRGSCLVQRPLRKYLQTLHPKSYVICQLASQIICHMSLGIHHMTNEDPKVSRRDGLCMYLLLPTFGPLHRLPRHNPTHRVSCLVSSRKC